MSNLSISLLSLVDIVLLSQQEPGSEEHSSNGEVENGNVWVKVKIFL